MRNFLVLMMVLNLFLANQAGIDRMPMKPLEPRSLVVIGEGLAAGVGDFSLTEEIQRESFPALMAQQLGTAFSQPLIQAPGIGNAPGFASLPVIAPGPQQTTVLTQFLLAEPPKNISVPGFRIRDSWQRRPVPPLFQNRDPQQSLVNLILGVPNTSSAVPLSQLDLAIRLKPTFVIVELGYYEAIQAAVEGEVKNLPDTATFSSNYGKIVKAIKETNAQLVLMTIPDPCDTAYLSTLDVAGRLVKADTGLLGDLYELRPNDLVTVQGLMEIGYQLTARSINKSLPKGSVLKGAIGADITRRVEALNTEIRSLAREYDAVVYDLNKLFKKVKREGFEVGSTRLSGDFLGGFFLLNGFYPGRTGHALIANEMLRMINDTWGTSYSPVDISPIQAHDPALLAQTAPGPNFNKQSLKELTFADLPPLPPLDKSDVVGFFPATENPGCSPPSGVPGCGLPISEQEKPLKLPPGREQTLSLNPSLSYYGDALRAVDCPDDKPLPGLERFPAFGTCGNVMFGGLAIGDVNLEGKIRIKFSEPVNGVSHFEISHPEGLFGKDGTLQAPKFFRLPFLLSVLRDVPKLVSSGNLDLNTGNVTNLQYYTTVFNTALWSLIGVNPNLPKRPLAFPGPAGSVTAKFEQRRDGLLDLSLAINGFLPLGTSLGGQAVRFPLPLCNPNFQCASIVARGTSLHPHIHLSTKRSLESTHHENHLLLPENTVDELTALTNNNSFGDVFGLNIGELGGPATGRSQLMGRVQVQFGKRFGDSLPFAISILPPGGLLATSHSLLQRMPKGIGPGFIGFDEDLKFPNLSYRMKELAFVSDPWNISLGAVDLHTGRVIGNLLHRGFVLQQLIFRLFDIEPCTPRTSFCYQGPALFQLSQNDDLMFEFKGRVVLPYPEGYKFPAPSGADGLTAGANSQLEPFLRIQAMSLSESPKLNLKGAAKLQSSIGQEFSYAYSIPCSPNNSKAVFEYINHTEGGTFKLTDLAWVSCTRLVGSEARSEPDTVTFTGFGIWSKDFGKQLHLVAAQISNTVERSYVGIQIDSGATSNVNTKPRQIKPAFP